LRQSASIMTLKIKGLVCLFATLSITLLWHYAECGVLFIVCLIMLNVVIPSYHLS
jgi:hypothetical protein